MTERKASLFGITIYGAIGKAFRGLVDVRLAKRHFQKTYSAIRLISTELVDYEMVKKEVWYLRWLSHPNIISIEEVFTIGPDVYILTPFYNLGSILFVIQTHCKFGLPEKAIAKIFKCLLSAVLYLHEQEIVHRSIRCSHILLSSTGEVKLSGLRNCAFVKRNQLTGVKSVLNDHSDNLMDGLLWLAPEVLKQDVHGYGVVSDVYSIGITLCEMANGFPPFFDMDQLQMLYEKEKGTTPRLLDRTTLKNSGVEVSQYQRLNRSFSVNFHNLTELCLRPDPETRPSVQKLRSHPFFRSMKRNRTFASLVPHITPIEPEEAQTLIDSESRVLSSSSFEWIFEN